MHSSEELSCAQLKVARGKRGPASKLHLQIDALAQLLKAKQQFAAGMLRNVLGQGEARWRRCSPSSRVASSHCASSG